jgi:hypothetical protein
MLPTLQCYLLPFPYLSFSTWTEFASDVNGKKLSKLVGQTDEEKLLDLCNTIEQQVQQLRPYQPIAKSQVLSTLCCRIPNHNKLPLFVVCAGASQPYCSAQLFACRMPQSFLTFPS